MAYLAKDLSVLAYANGFTLWHYATADVVGTVQGSGYFNDAQAVVRPGDLILTNTATGTTPVGDIFIVSTNSGGTVGLTKLV